MNSVIPSIVDIIIANEKMQLLAEKAIHIPEHDMLLIADLHFGKVEHFRKNGIGIPTGASHKDFKKLQNLIEKFKAKDVVFLGDLFHSDFNNAWHGFQEMIMKFPDNQFHLVLGNHDIMDDGRYEYLNVCGKMEIGNLILTHEPLEVIIEDKYNLCGHIHPGVRLNGKGKQNLRLPCFYFGKHTGILPAFGSFTGLHVIKPFNQDRVFVVNGEVVVEVN